MINIKVGVPADQLKPKYKVEKNSRMANTPPCPVKGGGNLSFPAWVTDMLRETNNREQ